MILPAGGVVMCWVMLTTLWLPALNYARSYEAVVRNVAQVVRSGSEQPACIQQYGLEDGQIAALLYYENLPLTRDRDASHCPWLLAYQGRAAALEHAIDMQQWQHVTTVRRAGSKADVIAIYRKRLQNDTEAAAASAAKTQP